MKPLENRDYSYEELRWLIETHIEEIMSHYPKLDKDKIEQVGVIEDGRLQLKVPDTFKNRQVVILVGYLKWLMNLK